MSSEAIAVQDRTPDVVTIAVNAAPATDPTTTTSSASTSASPNKLSPKPSMSRLYRNVPTRALTFRNLVYEVNVKVPDPDREPLLGGLIDRKIATRKALLRNVSGTCPPGKIFAIMGPSGSGKSTLLDVLAGRVSRGTYQGTVQIDGVDASSTVLRACSAYVPQNDDLFGVLTVRETLMYAAHFNCPQLTLAEKEERVEVVMEALGLSNNNTPNTKIGDIFFRGISGGQKRRVSMGIEMVSGPSILFLDEITSGLDSSSARAIIDVLCKLAKHGHTIIATIHQPSTYIFERLDYLMLLSAGRTCYVGPTANAVSFFEQNLGLRMPVHENPADWLLDCINTDFSQSNYIDTLNDAVHKNGMGLESAQQLVAAGAAGRTATGATAGAVAAPAASAASLAAAAPPTAGLAYSTLILLMRNLRNGALNPAVYWLRLIMYTGLCLCLASLYASMPSDSLHTQDRISILFFTCAFLTFMSVAAIPAFIQERPVFIRERTNGHYKPLAYAISHSLAALPFLFLIALISSLIQYYIIGLNTSDNSRFGIYVFALWIALYTADSMMAAISSIVPIFIVALAGGAGLLGVYMLLCGFFLLPGNIPIGWRWVHYAFSFHKYYFQAMMKNEFSGRVIKLIPCLNDSAGQPTVCYSTGESVLDQYDMSDVSIAMSLGVLFAMAVFYRIIFYLALQYLQTGKR